MDIVTTSVHYTGVLRRKRKPRLFSNRQGVNVCPVTNRPARGRPLYPYKQGGGQLWRFPNFQIVLLKTFNHLKQVLVSRRFMQG